jgi:hypothetical protein
MFHMSSTSPSQSEVGRVAERGQESELVTMLFLALSRLAPLRHSQDYSHDDKIINMLRIQGHLSPPPHAHFHLNNEPTSSFERSLMGSLCPHQVEHTLYSVLSISE